MESTQEGVPYCHDFVTRGYWEINALSNEQTEVKIWLWVVFIKTPIVKCMQPLPLSLSSVLTHISGKIAIIEKSSISGMKDFTVVWLAEAHKLLKKISKARSRKGSGDADIAAGEEEEEEEFKIAGAEKTPSSWSFLTSDWKLMAIIFLLALLLMISFISYLYISSLRSENERLSLLTSSSSTIITGGTSDVGVGMVQEWQKELEMLKQQIAKLQKGMAHWEGK